MNVLYFHARRRLAAAALAAAFVVSAAPALAIHLYAGAVVTAALSSADINSKNAYVGEPFSMRVVQPYPSGDPAYAGATIYGHVYDVRSAGQGRSAQLGFAFDKIVLRNGRSAHLTGHVVAAQTKEENTVVRQGAGALGGMIVGNYIGKHLGTNLGGLLGATGGYMYARNDRAQVYLPQGGQVQLRLDRPLYLS